MFNCYQHQLHLWQRLKSFPLQLLPCSKLLSSLTWIKTNTFLSDIQFVPLPTMSRHLSQEPESSYKKVRVMMTKVTLMAHKVAPNLSGSPILSLDLIFYSSLPCSLYNIFTGLITIFQINQEGPHLRAFALMVLVV